MTITAPSSSAVDDDHVAVRRALLPVALVATAIAITLSVLEANSNPERIVEVAVELVAGGLLFALVLPRGLRKPSAGGRGIVLGVIAVLLVVPAFWSGLPLLMGSAAALLGLAGRRADRGAGTAIAALVLGVLGVVGYASIYILDAVTH
ncbi:hypothetical protein [uncultured Amnibacterium sp.]|uniref:hypothetical protein n=1 Tax=uncultured Amnibacterium sp. TaxID=1631851 RepID=UPI0035C98A54